MFETSLRKINPISLCVILQYLFNKTELTPIALVPVENLKRVKIYKRKKWDDKQSQSPYFIEKCQEIKTTWHPTQV